MNEQYDKPAKRSVVFSWKKVTGLEEKEKKVEGVLICLHLVNNDLSISFSK